MAYLNWLLHTFLKEIPPFALMLTHASINVRISVERPSLFCYLITTEFCFPLAAYRIINVYENYRCSKSWPTVKKGTCETGHWCWRWSTSESSKEICSAVIPVPLLYNIHIYKIALGLKQVLMLNITILMHKASLSLSLSLINRYFKLNLLYTRIFFLFSLFLVKLTRALTICSNYFYAEIWKGNYMYVAKIFRKIYFKYCTDFH